MCTDALGRTTAAGLVIETWRQCVWQGECRLRHGQLDEVHSDDEIRLVECTAVLGVGQIPEGEDKYQLMRRRPTERRPHHIKPSFSNGRFDLRKISFALSPATLEGQTANWNGNEDLTS